MHIQFTDFHYNPRERDKHRHTQRHTYKQKNKMWRTHEHLRAHTSAAQHSTCKSAKKNSHKTHTRRYLRSRRERERENREHTHTHTQRDLKEGKSANFELRREKIKEGKSRLNILISGH